MAYKPRLLFIVLLIVLSQCGKRAAKVDPAFVGLWQGSDGATTYHLSIDDHSDALWQKDTHGVYAYIQGIARVEDNHLHIASRRFYINQYPQLDTASQIWSMVLSQVKYTR